MSISNGLQIVTDHVKNAHEVVTDRLSKVNPVVLVVASVGATIVYMKVSNLINRSDKPFRKRFASYIFTQLKRLPAVQRRIEKELGPAKQDILYSIHKDDSDRVFIEQIPSSGMTMEDVQKLAERYNSYGHFDVQHGKVSGTVYTDRQEDHLQLITKIYHDYAYSNPLHPDVFPGVRKMEAETIRMVLNLYNAPAGSSGSLTTGGTESIIMACFAYRNLALLGVTYGIPVHVDACLGGFMIPFMQDAGFNIPLFDFRLPGVTSISCDTHKYGCTPKGSSIVMYRTVDLHHQQFFSVPEWCGGIYATPTITGSRAGANAAVAWATLLYFGREEYVNRCKKIVQATRKIAKGIENIPGLKVHGSADVTVVAFKSDEYNIYAVGDRLHKKGYNLNTLQNPSAIHVCLTYNHSSDASVSAFLDDLRGAAAEVAALPDKGSASATAALYGMAAQIPDKTLVDEMAFAYLDACYAYPPPVDKQ